MFLATLLYWYTFQQASIMGVHYTAVAMPPCVLAEQMYHYIRVAKNILP